MRKMALSLAVAGVLAGGVSVAQAALITFDSYTTGALNSANTGGAWVVNNGTKFSIAASGGINNTKAITDLDQVIQPDGTAVYQTAINIGSGPITVSGFIKVVDPSNDVAASPLGFGLVGNATDALTTAANNSVQGRFTRINAGAMDYNFQIQNVSGGTTTSYIYGTVGGVGGFYTSGTGGLTATTFTATSGNWYFLSTGFTKSGNNVVVNLQLDNADSTGAIGAAIFNKTGTLANSAIANDTTVYGGFRAYTHSGMGAIDNVTVVPEPTSLSLLGLGAAGLLLRRRRS